MSDQHYKKLERMYLKAKINTSLYDTTTINISEGKSRITLHISEKYYHALDAVHGSVYFKLLDDAAFFAVNSMVTDNFVLTTSFNLNLIRPVQVGKLTCEGKIKYQSKNTFVAESILYNSFGKEVGFGTGNFVKSKMALSPEIGYL
ncbi:PaaI family thioesterase [Flagellimonas sp. S174]|uniref:PaaI family thioesterase n=1 Tax=Flagellimonas sp. S174 TaxID=3410790 RepID=UPI003BF4F6F4